MWVGDTYDQRKYDLARSWVAINEAIRDLRLRRRLLAVGAIGLRHRRDPEWTHGEIVDEMLSC